MSKGTMSNALDLEAIKGRYSAGYEDMSNFTILCDVGILITEITRLRESLAGIRSIVDSGCPPASVIASIRAVLAITPPEKESGR